MSELKEERVEKMNNNGDKSREVDADGMVIRKPHHNVFPSGMSSYQFFFYHFSKKTEKIRFNFKFVLVTPQKFN